MRVRTSWVIFNWHLSHHLWKQKDSATIWRYYTSSMVSLGYSPTATSQGTAQISICTMWCTLTWPGHDRGILWSWLGLIPPKVLRITSLTKSFSCQSYLHLLIIGSQVKILLYLAMVYIWNLGVHLWSDQIGFKKPSMVLECHPGGNQGQKCEIRSQIGRIRSHSSCGGSALLCSASSKPSYMWKGQIRSLAVFPPIFIFIEAS